MGLTRDLAIGIWKERDFVDVATKRAQGADGGEDASGKELARLDRAGTYLVLSADSEGGLHREGSA